MNKSVKNMIDLSKLKIRQELPEFKTRGDFVRLLTLKNDQEQKSLKRVKSRKRSEDISLSEDVEFLTQC